MALRCDTNINHCTITNQIRIAVQITQLVICDFHVIQLDCHLFFAVLIYKMRNNYKYRRLDNYKMQDFSFADIQNLSFLSVIRTESNVVQQDHSHHAHYHNKRGQEEQEQIKTKHRDNKERKEYTKLQVAKLQQGDLYTRGGNMLHLVRSPPEA